MAPAEKDRPVVATFPRQVWHRIIGTVLSAIILQGLALSGIGFAWAVKVEKSIVAIEATNEEQDRTLNAHTATLNKLADLASVERVTKLEEKLAELTAVVNQLVGELRARGVITREGRGP